MTTPLILCALLASGLALALSREHRIRLAFQALASRVLAKLRERSGAGFIPAHAGLFDWLARDTTKLEAANRAVHAAAEVVNESARLQADQNIAISEAIAALSSERSQLAGYLQHIGELATRDSQWAAALTTLGPVFIVVAVLAVGALALWLAYRNHSGDAELAKVLVESVTSRNPELNPGFFTNSGSDFPGPHTMLPSDTPHISSTTHATTNNNNDEGGFPF
jgi:hypothetical protein